MKKILLFFIFSLWGIKEYAQTFWMGGTSSDWNNIQNWQPAIIPDKNTDIEIRADIPHYPAIPKELITAVKNIKIDIDASFSVNGTLQVSGSISNNGGSFNITDGTLELNGSDPQTINGNLFSNKKIKNLIVANPSVTLSDSLYITGKLNFANINNAVLNTGNNLVIWSDTLATAPTTVIGDLTNGGANSGNSIQGKVIVKKQFACRRAWYLTTVALSNAGSIYDNWQNGGVYVPGQGTFITGPGATVDNGLDMGVNNNSSLKSFDINTQVLEVVTDTKHTMLTGNNGNADNKTYFIFVRGDRNPDNLTLPNSNSTVLSCNGFLQTGDQTFHFVAHSLPSSRAFNMIGNPYYSPVNFSRASVSANVVKRFTVWDPSLNQVGGYVTYDDADNTGNFISSLNSGSQLGVIHSGESFFVEATDSLPASVIFHETSKLSDNEAVSATNTASLHVSLNLLQPDNSTVLADGSTAVFNNSYNGTVDYEDALKFPNSNETLSFLRDGKTLSIEKRPAIGSTDTLFLKLVRATNREYQFAFTPDHLNDPKLQAFLQDSYNGTNTPIDLNTTTKVNFSVDTNAASQLTNRFAVVFTSGTVPVTFLNIKAWKEGANINLQWAVENQLNIQQYEIERSTNGVEFTKEETQSSNNNVTATYNWTDLAITNEKYFYYRIKAISVNGNIEYSQVVRVSVGDFAAGIAANPNPITSAGIGVQFTDMPAGQYQIRLLSSVGQVLVVKDIEHSGGNRWELISPVTNLSKGIYVLEVVKPDKTKTNLKLVY
ncbi:hypothetical protein [Ferruginibacter albus]|uniref:hypothetical protein n=1 Tax=Ferruginibacter albus TaxID=2875540 RepID=UPI001CC39F31|nr:hypothetical protein [Ferruginibacter albus]UAY50634.1 hypothetical protein K9M53_08505 [Ferruginibacter albus]